MSITKSKEQSSYFFDILSDHKNTVRFVINWNVGDVTKTYLKYFVRKYFIFTCLAPGQSYQLSNTVTMR